MLNFNETALEIFRRQALHCPPYADYLYALGVAWQEIERVEDIPFLPIETFRSRKVYCAETEPEMIFTSSTTGGDTPSRHYIASLPNYECSIRQCFEYFYGAVEQYSFYALLPNYLERKGSSLVYMLDKMISWSDGGFYLYDYERLLADMAADPSPKILFGVTYALLELAEKYAPKLSDTIVMETGGMKGRRAEMPKSELHAVLRSAFGVTEIHSEYSMAELNSQFYSHREGIFECPPSTRVTITDPLDPTAMLGEHQTGRINIIDLANRDSCSFIATEDLGRTVGEGRFMLEGRIAHSQTRGCNLLILNSEF